MIRNESYWETKHFFNYDIVIIGSGIVGLNAAITLGTHSPSLRIAILEAGSLPSGASTKNAGFACFGSVSELIDQEAIMGTTDLHALIKKRWLGLKKLRDRLGDEQVGFDNFGGYELFRHSEDALSGECIEKLSHFNALVKDITGDNDTFRVENAKISEFGFTGVQTLIGNVCESQIDTGKMMFNLLKMAAGMGVMIFNTCKVHSFDTESNSFVVKTSTGRFTARRLIVAANAFVKDLLPEIDVRPGRGQVLVTKPIKGLRLKGTYHYDKGFYYFRNIDGRILLGGGRNLAFAEEETTQPGTTAIIHNSLKDLLETVILPGKQFEIEQVWSGVMSFGSKVGPYIEEVRPGVFCATRCSGMGVAIGAQTGEDVALLTLQSI